MITVCVWTAKPGQCPAAPDNLTGVVCKPHNECEIDADCDSNLKCCSNGCRLTCQKPGTVSNRIRFTLTPYRHLKVFHLEMTP